MHQLKYSGGRHTNKTSGYMIITEPDKPTIEAETVSCVHCQFTWAIQPGSGMKRGFCFPCGGPTCGKKKCTEKCAPWELQMEIAEGKKRFWQQLGRVLQEQILTEKFTAASTIEMRDRRSGRLL